MKYGTYIGPLVELAGCRAMVTEGPGDGRVSVQFDVYTIHPETHRNLGYGLHRFLEMDFELDTEEQEEC